MKVLVIGGSKGVGLDIVNHFDGDSISRNATDPGFNIRKDEDRTTIANLSLDYDVVVNHAYSGDFSQTLMLLNLFETWVEAKHKGYLFNSGSDSSKIYRMKSSKDPMYAVLKASQNTLSHFISRNIQEGNTPMRYTNIIYGMLDTEKARARPHYKNGVRGADICTVIEMLYNLPTDCLIPEFVMEARDPT